ncbi:MAG: Ig-like domain-containing protein [Bacteroidales bacterium]|nr:Ig-like domain-containing protein [Bacteroidales bacterium]
MTTQETLRTLLFLCVATLVAACARTGYPSGGETDRTPPEITKVSPENRTTNFNGKSFTLETDEYVVLKDVNNQVIISPPMKQFPQITSTGKKIKVVIKDTLQEKTTYLFQFRDAIADNNEGNLLSDFSYVFSTGASLDSLSFCGNVNDALTGEPDKKIFVFLYNTFDDSVVTSHPAYATKTDDKGCFRFQYLADKKYKIIALDDLDKSYTYNSVAEKIGFSSDTITPYYLADSVKPDYSQYALKTFVQESAVQRVAKSDFVSKGKVQISTVLPMQNPTVDADSVKIFWLLNATRDTINLWLIDKELDSLKLILRDSSGIDDTLKMRRFNRRGPVVGGNAFMKANFANTLPYFDTFCLTFTNPIEKITDAATAVYYKTATDSAFATIVFDTISRRKATLLIPVIQDEKYDITVFGGHFHDIFGTSNDTTKIKTEVTTAEKYGNIILNFEAPDNSEHYVLQLLSSSGKVVDEQTFAGSQKVLFKHLSAGTYKVRAIKDDNANSKWDSGNYWEKRQAEESRYFEKEIKVRENWDFEETFKWQKQ